MRAASFRGCFFFNMNILFQAFNQLSTEIIITDLDFHIITMNESAASNGWKSDSLNHSKALERVISKSKINKSELPSLDSLIDDESFENELPKLKYISGVSYSNWSNVISKAFLFHQNKRISSDEIHCEMKQKIQRELTINTPNFNQNLANFLQNVQTLSKLFKA